MCQVEVKKSVHPQASMGNPTVANAMLGHAWDQSQK
jgi:hypothetical protein